MCRFSASWKTCEISFPSICLELFVTYLVEEERVSEGGEDPRPPGAPAVASSSHEPVSRGRGHQQHRDQGGVVRLAQHRQGREDRPEDGGRGLAGGGGAGGQEVEGAQQVQDLGLADAPGKVSENQMFFINRFSATCSMTF